jgi:hypothetical protein
LASPLEVDAVRKEAEDAASIAARRREAEEAKRAEENERAEKKRVVVIAAICLRVPLRSVAAVFQRTVNEPEAPYHHDAETQVHENIHHGSPSSQYDVPARA